MVGARRAAAAAALAAALTRRAQAHFTLEGHEKGVNAVDYAVAGDKPYIVSGADDKMVKVWDYQNKTCVQVCVASRVRARPHRTTS